MTYLMYAAKNNYQSIIKKSLNDDFGLNQVDKNGNNVLFHAVVCPKFIASEDISNNTFPQQLINSSVDINHTNNNGETALIYCIKNNKFKPIRYLIGNHNIDVNITDNDGKTAAIYLTEKGNCKDLLSLHRKNCHYDYVNYINNQSVLSIVLDKIYSDRNPIALRSYYSILTILVTYQIDFNIPVDRDGNTTFMVMLGLKDFENVKFFITRLRKLDLGVKNKFGENATSLCYKLGYSKIIELLQGNPTFNYHYRDPTNQNTLLIYSVINSIDPNILLENVPELINEVNCNDENALIIASKINNYKAVEELLKKGININQQDILGNTALHYAVETERPYLTYLLMTKNPDINLKNKEGKTAKDLANEIGNKKILETLNNPSYRPNLSDDNNNNTKHEQYAEEIKTYITSYVNNNYPNYKPDNKLNKTIQKEIYGNFSNPEKKY